MTEEDKLSAAVDSTLNIKFILFSLLDFFFKEFGKNLHFIFKFLPQI
jgi:hypothetical protein